MLAAYLSRSCYSLFPSIDFLPLCTAWMVISITFFDTATSTFHHFSCFLQDNFLLRCAILGFRFVHSLTKYLVPYSTFPTSPSTAGTWIRLWFMDIDSSKSGNPHLRTESSATQGAETTQEVVSAEQIMDQTLLHADGSQHERSDNVKERDNKQTPSRDPWFQKHGVNGFLRYELLVEDMPADRWILGPPPPTLPKLSPRSDARSMAKVCNSNRQYRCLWLTSTD